MGAYGMQAKDLLCYSIHKKISKMYVKMLINIKAVKIIKNPASQSDDLKSKEEKVSRFQMLTDCFIWMLLHACILDVPLAVCSYSVMLLKYISDLN